MRRKRRKRKQKTGAVSVFQCCTLSLSLPRKKTIVTNWHLFWSAREERLGKLDMGKQLFRGWASFISCSVKHSNEIVIFVTVSWLFYSISSLKRKSALEEIMEVSWIYFTETNLWCSVSAKLHMIGCLDKHCNWLVCTSTREEKIYWSVHFKCVVPVLMT